MLDKKQNAVLPVHGNGDKPGVDVAPALDGEENLSRLGTAVEYRHIIKRRGIFNVNPRMVLLEVISEKVVDTGIAAADHHQGLTI